MDVPGVPGAFVMLNVLTRGECAVLSTVAERIGFVPDHPSSRPAPSGIGGLEWLLTDGTSAPTSPRLTPCVLPISALCSADRPAPYVLRRPVGGAARALPALSTGHARRRQAGWHQQPLPPLQVTSPSTARTSHSPYLPQPTPSAACAFHSPRLPQPAPQGLPQPAPCNRPPPPLPCYSGATAEPQRSYSGATAEPQRSHSCPSPPHLAPRRLVWHRYTDAEKAVYRPHIDGSWPGSGLDASGRYASFAMRFGPHPKRRPCPCPQPDPGPASRASPSPSRYVHDAFSGRRSRLTFLVYLNDGFEGGCTTFYTPSRAGGLQAQGVQPRAGAVLCFPQGNTASLLHEGSAVRRGSKDVIRSDVLYTTPAPR